MTEHWQEFRVFLQPGPPPSLNHLLVEGLVGVLERFEAQTVQVVGLRKVLAHVQIVKRIAIHILVGTTVVLEVFRTEHLNQGALLHLWLADLLGAGTGDVQVVHHVN